MDAGARTEHVLHVHVLGWLPGRAVKNRVVARSSSPHCMLSSLSKPEYMYIDMYMYGRIGSGQSLQLIRTGMGDKHDQRALPAVS